MSLVQPCQDGGKDKGKKENDPKKLHKNRRLESLDRQNFKYVSHPPIGEHPKRAETRTISYAHFFGTLVPRPISCVSEWVGESD